DRRAVGGVAMAITTSYRTRSDAVPLRSFKAKGRPSAIAGVGVYAPEKVISNFDLEKMMETSDKWITERTGIHRRHIAEPGTTTFEMATRAARAALDAAGIAAQELDMILVGTSSPDGPFPSVACRVQNELDAPGAVAWDTLAACTSFVYALSIADSFIATERADTVLVIGAEVLSRMIDYSNRGTAVIFGDAAARRIGLPMDRVAVNIDEYGNTSSASIPLALEEAIRKGRVKSGDHVLLAGFGSGLTWGATLLKWAYRSCPG